MLNAKCRPAYGPPSGFPPDHERCCARVEVHRWSHSSGVEVSCAVKCDLLPLETPHLLFTVNLRGHERTACRSEEVRRAAVWPNIQTEKDTKPSWRQEVIPSASCSVQWGKHDADTTDLGAVWKFTLSLSLLICSFRSDSTAWYENKDGQKKKTINVFHLLSLLCDRRETKLQKYRHALPPRPSALIYYLQLGP